MGKIEAIIYDVDGTLLDTREWILQAFEHTAEHFGFEAEREILHPVIGQSLESIYELLAPEIEYEKLHKKHEEFQTANIDMITAYDGAKEQLATYKSKKQAIVTSRTGNLEYTLEHGNIDGYYETVVKAGDVNNHKPHPQGLLLAMSTIGSEPSKTVYVGDGVVDMEAAKRAHMTAIGITHGFGKEEDLLRFGADHIVHSHHELTKLIAELD